MNKKDIWVVCQYFSEDRYDEVCPDDLEKFLQLFPYQKAFQCVGEDDKFIYLKQENNVYRVKDSLVKAIEEPKFKIGETVMLSDKNEEAIVVSIGWHYKFAEPIYIVKVNGKIKRKRYFTGDLQKIAAL